MKINIKELKTIVSKLNVAIEKNKVNPKSGWVELYAVNGLLTLKVANYDYFLEMKLNVECDSSESIHATVVADTFIPLVSKLDDNTMTIFERGNTLVFASDTNEYTFPIIKELGKVKSIDTISFNQLHCKHTNNKGYSIASIANTNAKGLVDSVFSKDIQQFIYIDDIGALTFTENIYVNNFETTCDLQFKMLLNCTQAKLLKIFEDYDTVDILTEISATYETSYKVMFRTDNISLILITQSAALTDKFPAIRLRQLADRSNIVHAVIDKKKLDKALARLMVFDKRFDITVMNYSKLVFGTESLKLVSIKNNNYEVVPYISAENAIEHEAIIRFADLVKQLKAINTKEVDIGYGTSSAIVINGNVKQLIPEIRMVDKV